VVTNCTSPSDLLGARNRSSSWSVWSRHVDGPANLSVAPVWVLSPDLVDVALTRRQPVEAFLVLHSPPAYPLVLVSPGLVSRQSKVPPDRNGDRTT
jgi:hypothetical protein